MRSRACRRWSRRKMIAAVICLLTLSACGTQPTARPPGAPLPLVLMLPPTRLSGLVLVPAGPKVKPSDIERQKKLEAEVCGATEEQLIALQKWAAETQETKTDDHD